MIAWFILSLGKLEKKESPILILVLEDVNIWYARVKYNSTFVLSVVVDGKSDQVGRRR